MQTVTKTDDVNADTLTTWSSFLESVSNNPFELSDDSKSVLQNIAITTMEYAKGTDIDYRKLIGVLQAADAVASIFPVLVDNNNGNSRRNLLETAAGNNSAKQILSITSQYSDIVSGSKIVGEAPSEFVYSSFRMITSAFSTYSDQSLSIAVPTRTAVEDFTDAERTSLQLHLDENGTAAGFQFAATIIQTYPKSFTSDVTKFYADPIRLLVVPSGNASVAELFNGFLVSVRNNEAVRNFKFGNESNHQNFTTICKSANLAEKKLIVINAPLLINRLQEPVLENLSCMYVY